MKKITDYIIENEEYKETILRYYSGKELILENEDANFFPSTGNRVNIEGNVYFVEEIVFYPEICIVDIIMVSI
jgi:glutamine synthetase type III